MLKKKSLKKTPINGNIKTTHGCINIDKTDYCFKDKQPERKLPDKSCLKSHTGMKKDNQLNKNKSPVKYLNINGKNSAIIFNLAASKQSAPKILEYN